LEGGREREITRYKSARCFCRRRKVIKRKGKGRRTIIKIRKKKYG